LHSLKQLGWTPEWESAFDKIENNEDLEPARVLEEQKDLLRVGTARGTLRAVTAGRLRHAAAGPEELPAVGDWVAVDARAPAEGRSRVHALLPRRTALLRKTAFRRTQAQVVAANLDTVFCVTSLNRDFNPRRLERYLALVWESGARPVLLLNKADLCADAEARRAEAETLAMGVPVHTVSARDGLGLDALGPHLVAGETTAVIGSSGVGKSTLINRLAGAELLLVKEIRTDDDRGRHTTTHRQLVRLPAGALLIDTPGMRELALWESEEGLEQAFSEIEEVASRCRFRDCGHDGEPGCAIRAALDDGTLDAERWASYVKLKRELAHLARRQSERATLDTKRRWKRMTIANRSRPRKGYR
jgi:ribosome biogenesis GTPase